MQGPLRSVLTGERTALNFLTHLSGVATRTYEFAHGDRRHRLRRTRHPQDDTRDAPAREGGRPGRGRGQPPRRAVRRAARQGQPRRRGRLGRQRDPPRHRPLWRPPVQIEVDSLEQLDEAIEAGARDVLLDNFDVERPAGGRTASANSRPDHGRILLESSGRDHARQRGRLRAHRGRPHRDRCADPLRTAARHRPRRPPRRPAPSPSGRSPTCCSPSTSATPTPWSACSTATTWSSTGGCPPTSSAPPTSSRCRWPGSSGSPGSTCAARSTAWSPAASCRPSPRWSARWRPRYLDFHPGRSSSRACGPGIAIRHDHPQRHRRRPHRQRRRRPRPVRRRRDRGRLRHRHQLRRGQRRRGVRRRGASPPASTSRPRRSSSARPALPKVETVAPPSPIGRSTVTALQSGIVYGFAGQVDGIVRRIAAELGGRRHHHRDRRLRPGRAVGMRDHRRLRPVADARRAAYHLAPEPVAAALRWTMNADAAGVPRGTSMRRPLTVLALVGVFAATAAPAAATTPGEPGRITYVRYQGEGPRQLVTVDHGRDRVHPGRGGERSQRWPGRRRLLPGRPLAGLPPQGGREPRPAVRDAGCAHRRHRDRPIFRAGEITAPTWSPDGRQVAAYSNSNDSIAISDQTRAHLYSVQIEGQVLQRGRHPLVARRRALRDEPVVQVFGRDRQPGPGPSTSTGPTHSG